MYKLLCDKIIDAPEADNNDEDEQEHIINVNTTKMSQLSFITRSKNIMCELQLDFNRIWVDELPETPPWIINNIKICADIIQHAKRKISEPVLKMIFTNHINTHQTNQDETILYTDGSKTADGTAFAVVRMRPPLKEARKMHHTASVFTAELTAMLCAVIKSRAFSEKSVTIISDSKSSIQAIASLQSKNPLAIEIRTQCYETDKTFHFCWVPSHVDIRGNEHADKLAKDATKYNVRMSDQLLQADCKTVVRRKFKDLWTQRWISCTGNKLRGITDSLSPLPNSSCSNRKWERVLARLRIGHSRLTHNYLLSGGSNAEAPTCEECPDGAALTIEHMLRVCSAYNNARRQAFRRTAPSMTYILKDCDTSLSGPLAKFLTDTGLINRI